MRDNMVVNEKGVCGWCRKTDELVPMRQGGVVHTTCPECGSSGPVLEMNDFGASYSRIRKRNKEVESFITFLANRHPTDGPTKAQILRMADRLMHGGTWQEDHIVVDVRTPLEMAQGRILELEQKLDESLVVQTEIKECLAALWHEFEITVDGVDAALGSEDLEAAADAISDTDEARELRKRIIKLGVG